MKGIGDLQSLELRTPSLRALHMDDAYCYDMKAFTLLAPMLQEFTVSNQLYLKIYILMETCRVWHVDTCFK